MELTEEKRLDALRALRLLDTPPEQEFDDLARLCATLFGVPMATVSLVDRDRQWFKSALGLSVCETPREHAICHYTIQGSDVFVVPDTRQDLRFANSPLVTQYPFLRFYAGFPLRTPNGEAVGALCALDTVPHRPTSAQLESLRQLGRQVERLLAMRLLVLEQEQIIASERLAQEALRSSESMMRDILENAHDLIHSVRSDGSFEFVNRMWMETLGYGELDIQKLNIKDIVPEASGLQQVLPHSCKEDATPYQSIQATFQTRDGREIPVEGTISCRPSARGNSVYRGIFRDISQRKAAEKMREDLYTFVSHELRTPLTAIHGSLGLLRGGVTGRLEEPSAKLVDVAYRSSERMAALINDFLDSEKLRLGKFELQLQEIDFRSVLRQSMEEMGPYAAKFLVQLATDDPQTPLPVRGNPDRLVQVMANFISNAVKHSPTGGVVRVAVRKMYDNRTLRVSVCDNGPGISPELKPRIFQEFAQGAHSTRSPGTGLGLVITRGIIEQHQGRVWFSSQPGQNTVFSFELPLLDGSQTAG